ncbi:MAG: sugar phosphate isomerase/epimerase family protein [Planctomycetaceae bacterium]
MSLFRFALPTAPFRQPLRNAIRSVAATGADGVQFDVRHEVSPQEFGDTARQQLRHFLRENSLRIGACTLPTQGTLVDADRLDQRVAAIQRGLEFVRQLGSDVLTVRLGAIPAEVASPAYERLSSILADLATHSNRVGAKLAVSSLGNAPEKLISLLDTVTTGRIGIDFDPAGCIFAALSPPAVLRELHSRAAHVQLRDGTRTAEGAGIETAIGAGDVPWDEYLATVAEINHRGWSTVRRTGGDDLVGDLVRGLRYVRNVTAG